MTDKRASGFALTKIACYIGIMVQAVTINFVPMLFVAFMGEFGLGVGQISALVALTFIVQFTVDFLCVFIVGRVSYRALSCTAHILAAAGLALMPLLPYVTDPFLGLCIAVLVYSTGSGLIEVIVSPIVESCPSSNKTAEMSLLHSFYCWGQTATVILSTVFFCFAGIDSWRVLSLVWAAVPLVNFFLFLSCPMNTSEQSEKSMRMKTLISNCDFLLLLVIIMCAGAAELAVAQWASAYCETALGVDKTVGDLAGPMAFAVCMGIARVGYGILGNRVRLERYMLASGILCVAGYLVIAFAPYAWLGLAGFGICGLAVGVLWPGTLSLAARHVDGGGTMFAMLSFAGDAGCTLGPFIAGMLAESAGGDIGYGISAAAVFPLVLCVAVALLILRLGKKEKNTAVVNNT